MCWKFLKCKISESLLATWLWTSRHLQRTRTSSHPHMICKSVRLHICNLWTDIITMTPRSHQKGLVTNSSQDQVLAVRKWVDHDMNPIMNHGTMDSRWVHHGLTNSSPRISNWIIHHEGIIIDHEQLTMNHDGPMIIFTILFIVYT